MGAGKNGCTEVRESHNFEQHPGILAQSNLKDESRVNIMYQIWSLIATLIPQSPDETAQFYHSRIESAMFARIQINTSLLQMCRLYMLRLDTQQWTEETSF